LLCLVFVYITPFSHSVSVPRLPCGSVHLCGKVSTPSHMILTTGLPSILSLSFSFLSSSSARPVLFLSYSSLHPPVPPRSSSTSNFESSGSHFCRPLFSKIMTQIVRQKLRRRSYGDRATVTNSPRRTANPHQLIHRSQG